MYSKDFIGSKICRCRVVYILYLVVAKVESWYSSVRVKNCLGKDSEAPITQLIVCKVEILYVNATFMASTS